MYQGVYLTRNGTVFGRGFGISSARKEGENIPIGACIPTILVVEDAESLRKMIASMLRVSGYNVLEASDGAQALAVFAQETNHIDLVLTDVKMPQMSGIELAERVSLLRHECPVVFMSGYMEDPIVEGVKNGSAYFLRKPFTAQALVEVIQRNLQRGHAVDSAT